MPHNRIQTEHAGDLILVVDDDDLICQVVKRILVKAGYEVEICYSGEECLSTLRKTMPLAICLDMHLPGMSGLDTLKRVQKNHPNLPVIFLTHETEVETVVAAVREGAFDYLAKPVDAARLLTQIRNAVDRARMAIQIAHLEREAHGKGYPGMVGESQAMISLQRHMDRLSNYDTTVLIHGESGSGKELVARGIHATSGRRQGPFVALNCAAIPESLQEAELFGHEKGAFTGATDRRIGCFEQADGGTLLLDEVGELSDAQQAKLLRTIQERRFRRIGGQQEISSDFRLLAATHRNLEDDVANKRFREDLFFRIAVFELSIPPLRDRKSDIPLLIDHFITKYADSRAGEIEIAPETLLILRKYNWPGNIRELENVIQHMLVVTQDHTILPEHLPRRVAKSSPGYHSLADENPEKTEPNFEAHAQSLGTLNLEELERQAIAQALEQSRGNLSQAGRILGISRSSVYRKIRRYGIETTTH